MVRRSVLRVTDLCGAFDLCGARLGKRICVVIAIIAFEKGLAKENSATGHRYTRASMIRKSERSMGGLAD
jgi:hypothetical protein